jgi:hypothetical protein
VVVVVEEVGEDMTQGTEGLVELVAKAGLIQHKVARVGEVVPMVAMVESED